MTTNTEALAIAEALEKRLDCSSLVLTADVERAAAELRRLSAVEAENGNLSGMAGCMDMLRQDLIEAGVIGISVAPMFMTEAILSALQKANGERDKFASESAQHFIRAREWAERAGQMEAERDALQVGIELMQDNAARYCWLRDNEDGDYGICVWDSDDGWARDARSPAVVDAAIDAAMKGTQ